MRRWAMASVVILAGCSLMIDTSGLSGGGVDAGTGTDARPAQAPVIEAGGDVVVAPIVADDDAGPLDAEASVPEASIPDAGPVLPPDLVAAWTFEGDVASDVTGHGHDGTVTNAKYVTGKYGRALDFGFSSRSTTATPLSAWKFATAITSIITKATRRIRTPATATSPFHK